MFEAPDRLMFGSTRFMFLKLANAQPSAGSAVDHVGFSVPDIDATFKELEAGIHMRGPDTEAGSRGKFCDFAHGV